MQDPTFIAVDVRSTLDIFRYMPNMQAFFSRFPIEELTQIILQQNGYDTNDEFFWNEFEQRFSDEMYKYDLDHIALMYETITAQLDEDIRGKINYRCDKQHIDTANYIFDRWIGPTSLILMYDEQNAYKGDGFAIGVHQPGHVSPPQNLRRIGVLQECTLQRFTQNRSHPA